MSLPKESPLPGNAFLGKYRESGAYTDCLKRELRGQISLAQLIEAFYTCAVFRPERIILGLIGKPSTNLTARRLAVSEIDRFAAWHVEARSLDQILLCDFQGRTRSWLMVVPQTGADGAESTALYFGSAITTIDESPAAKALARATFAALLWFHKVYSRLLLWSAARRLSALSPAPAPQR
jgi:hypothetical protein